MIYVLAAHLVYSICLAETGANQRTYQRAKVHPVAVVATFIIFLIVWPVLILNKPDDWRARVMIYGGMILVDGSALLLSLWLE